MSGSTVVATANNLMRLSDFHAADDGGIGNGFAMPSIISSTLALFCWSSRIRPRPISPLQCGGRRRARVGREDGGQPGRAPDRWRGGRSGKPRTPPKRCARDRRRDERPNGACGGDAARRRRTPRCAPGQGTPTPRTTICGPSETGPGIYEWPSPISMSGVMVEPLILSGG